MESLLAYLDSSPSPWHAVASSCRQLGGRRIRRAGRARPVGGPPGGRLRRAWRSLDRLATAVDGSTTVDPHRRRAHGLALPAGQAESRTRSRAGWRQLGVEVYGGVLLNSWLDRDLGLAGRVLTTDGESTLVHVDAAIARVPQLAIHLDRDVNEQRTRARPAGPSARPCGRPSCRSTSRSGWAACASLDGTPAWWELCLYDIQPARVLGADRSMLASGRLDNLVSCWAATTALAAAAPSADSP